MFPKLFLDQLGTYPHQRVHLEIDKNAKPVVSRPHPVPQRHEDMFKKELDCLFKIGVLERCGAAEWLSPTFCIPKKDDGIHVISDMRTLNKVLKCKVHNLPKIQNVLCKCQGCQFFTKIDISTQHCTFELDDESKDLCTICKPFGNF